MFAQPYKEKKRKGKKAVVPPLPEFETILPRLQAYKVSPCLTNNNSLPILSRNGHGIYGHGHHVKATLIQQLSSWENPSSHEAGIC